MFQLAPGFLAASTEAGTVSPSPVMHRPAVRHSMGNAGDWGAHEWRWGVAGVAGGLGVAGGWVSNFPTKPQAVNL
jgi:hypothetical protein